MQLVIFKTLSSRLRDLCRREGRGTLRARGGVDDSKVTVSPRHSRDELVETVRACPSQYRFKPDRIPAPKRVREETVPPLTRKLFPDVTY